MIHQKDMQRKAYRADHHQKIRKTQAETILQAKKIQADQRHQNTDPDIPSALFLQSHTKDRHQQDITGRQETGLSGFCTGSDAQLLKGRCHKHHTSTGDPARKQCSFLLPGLGFPVIFLIQN